MSDVTSLEGALKLFNGQLAIRIPLVAGGDKLAPFARGSGTVDSEPVTRALFLCSQNKLRSPTAEQVFSGRRGLEVDSAGLNHDAAVPVSPEQLAWADIIFVMEMRHVNRLSKRFRSHLRGKRVICLNIPDEFTFMQPELVSLLEARVTLHLRESPHDSNAT